MKKVIIQLLVLCWWFTSCDRTHNDPGYDYFPDMFYSKAYETYSENPNFADGKTLREPVEGTIPTDIIPYPYEKNDTDRLLAGKELVNPLPVTTENLGRGEAAYKIYCINCHGSLADGKGNLFTSGLYTFKPASLVNDKMKKVPDGEIFHVIIARKTVTMAFLTIHQKIRSLMDTN